MSAVSTTINTDEKLLVFSLKNGQVANNYEVFEHVEPNTFPAAINTALDDCERAHDLLLTMKSDLEDVSAEASSTMNDYLNVSLHVNNALQSSIRSIGHGGSLIGRLR